MCVCVWKTFPLPRPSLPLSHSRSDMRQGALIPPQVLLPTSLTGLCLSSTKRCSNRSHNTPTQRKRPQTRQCFIVLAGKLGEKVNTARDTHTHRREPGDLGAKLQVFLHGVGVGVGGGGTLSGITAVGRERSSPSPISHGARASSDRTLNVRNIKCVLKSFPSGRCRRWRPLFSALYLPVLVSCLYCFTYRSTRPQILKGEATSASEAHF